MQCVDFYIKTIRKYYTNNYSLREAQALIGAGFFEGKLTQTSYKSERFGKKGTRLTEYGEFQEVQETDNLLRMMIEWSDILLVSLTYYLRKTKLDKDDAQKVATILAEIQNVNLIHGELKEMKRKLGNSDLLILLQYISQAKIEAMNDQQNPRVNEKKQAIYLKNHDVSKYIAWKKKRDEFEETQIKESLRQLLNQRGMSRNLIDAINRITTRRSSSFTLEDY